MIVPGSVPLLFAGGTTFGGYRSLRFAANRRNKLRRVFAQMSDLQCFTLSWWHHRTAPYGIVMSTISDGSAGSEFTLGYDDQNRVYLWDGGKPAEPGSPAGVNSRLMLRSANSFVPTRGWQHFVLAIDTKQSTAGTRALLWVNRSPQPFEVNFLKQNELTPVGKPQMHAIGGYAAATDNTWTWLDGPISDFVFVTGQQLTPDYFGELRDDKWVPRDFAGTYGTNGFWLPFVEGTIGKPNSPGMFDDASPNKNHWSGENFIRARDYRDCWLFDHPRTPFPVLDANAFPVTGEQPLIRSNGGLDFTAESGMTYAAHSIGTEYLFTGGRTYVELTARSAKLVNGTNYPKLTLVNITSGAVITQFPAAAPATGEVHGVAIDWDNGKYWLRHPSGSWVNGDPALGGTPSGTFVPDAGGFTLNPYCYGNAEASVNFGQREYTHAAPPSFAVSSKLKLRAAQQFFTADIVISQETQRFNLNEALVALGWNGMMPVICTVTVNAGVWVGTTHTNYYAMTLSELPTGSQLTLINNGVIAGAGGPGGNGGTGGDKGGAGGQPGAAGGPSLNIRTPVKIRNNGTIAGGGGGGGGQGGGWYYWYVGGGGGGGAGFIPGIGGSPNPSGANKPGQPGTRTNGGAGGGPVDGYETFGTGGQGGNLGVAGVAGPPVIINRRPTGGPGGAAGHSIVGTRFVTWEVTGTVLGPQIA